MKHFLFYEQGANFFLDTEDDGNSPIVWRDLRMVYRDGNGLNGGCPDPATYRAFLCGYLEARASYRLVEVERG